MRRIGTILSLAAIAVLLSVGVFAQVALARHRPGDAPAMNEGVIAALGGFRSLVAEAIWFRADRLQDEGRFGELVQLTSLLTYLEPHDAEVWNYASWNLAYNISARIPQPEDRWRWVYAGIRLLRDEGLKWNPSEPRIYFELADRFEMKVGTDQFDPDALLYQAEWARIVDEVARSGEWHRIGMDPAVMAEVEASYREAEVTPAADGSYPEAEIAYRRTGRLDWRNAQASAMYWSHQGLKHATGRTRLLLLQKLALARQLYGNPNRPPRQEEAP